MVNSSTAFQSFGVTVAGWIRGYGREYCSPGQGVEGE